MAFRYRELADALIQEIESGGLQQGHRLPSIRAMSQQRGVSITTVKRCYESLEAQGYLLSRAQSGFYVRDRQLTLLQPEFPVFDPSSRQIDNLSIIAEIHQSAINAHRVQLGTIQLAPSLLPVQALQRSLVRANRRAQGRALAYSQAAGEPVLLQALQAHFQQDGITCALQDLVVTNGCMEALSLAVDAVTRPGDTLALPSPCYSGQLQLLASMGRRVSEIPSTSRGFDLDRLEQLMADQAVSACLVATSYQNPLGYCLDAADKQRLAEMALRYRCPVIEDDVFGECGHTRQRPLPVKSWSRDGWVIWCGSVSKTLAPGYRIGWCSSGRFHPQVRLAMLARGLSVNTPLQLALADFMLSGEYRRHLNRLRLQLAAQVNSLCDSLRHHLDEHCRLAKPDGGYAVWVQLPEHCQGLQVYQAMKAQGINLVPGEVFSARNLYSNAVRLNAGNPWNAELERAVATLAESVRTLAPDACSPAGSGRR
ncbi:PLP-dependent aminotransferase family protein [Kineobactrum salinum]|uniref:PLP-dependent aminotransferase family protein n=1 Tax=Kineobactrum salinum TaxID=2708301 RepID=A0A6C0TXL3_9GAMM|nr:PLP-dependent aminotransferase family protein [Kineobactrum salinum]QIB64531.1 PLP-dependent aminotransferase family protein [Kineobactrum salinum]